jgi:hypothetical protein
MTVHEQVIHIANGEKQTFVLHIQGEGDPDAAFDAASLVMEMDPEEVEAEALKRQEWGGGNLTTTILNLVVEKLNGAEPEPGTS